MSHYCNSTGTRATATSTATRCRASPATQNSGLCSGACAPQSIGTSYIGCEYYPTITGNPVGDSFQFAVAIANTSASDATITIEGGALSTPDTFTVSAGSVKVEKLPWQIPLKLCSGATSNDCVGGVQAKGAMATGGAYHLRSTAPITVYEFNPLDYTDGGGANFSYSNDASLLLPTNVWRSEYYTANYHQTGNVFPAEFAVTAWQDGTTVTITTKANTAAGGGAPAFTAGTPQMVTLNAGDVLELTSIQTEAVADLTGSHIQSDKPVEVISGHYCVYVPDDTVGYCDHIEESMFSVDALGNNYIVNAPAVTSLPSGKVEVVRIIGTVGNTNLTYDPPQAGAPATIANPGDYVEISGTTASFKVTADHKVMVAQYMEGQDAGGGTGDPAMALAVPVEQFRTSYLFHAPTNYESNYVDITAPDGGVVMLDGTMVTGFTPIGSTGYSLARVQALGGGPNADGNHSVTGSMPFGITVYGYGQYTSYWYAGGLDLTDIPVN